MKIRLIISLLFLTFVANVDAQIAQEIRSIAVVSKGKEWYDSQVTAWQKVVAANPCDAHAWKNLYMATCYSEHYEQDKNTKSGSDSESVLRRMGEAVPESYEYSFCRLRDLRTSNDEVSALLDVLVARIDEITSLDDISLIMAKVWRSGLAYGGGSRESLLHDLCERLYVGNYYTDHMLRYIYNSFNGMESGSLYFANGDNILQSPLVLQQMGLLNQSITIIPLSFLFDDDFRNALCLHLGIGRYTANASYASYQKKDYIADIVNYIIKATGRTAYFFPDVLHHADLDKSKLYNEGLLLKYSEVPYDNFSVAMRNVEERFHLDYLGEPPLIHTDWNTDRFVDVNVVLFLSHLVSRLREAGKTEQSVRLYHQLRAGAERLDNIPRGLQKQLLDDLKKQLKKE